MESKVQHTSFLKIYTRVDYCIICILIFYLFKTFKFEFSEVQKAVSCRPVINVNSLFSISFFLGNLFSISVVWPFSRGHTRHKTGWATSHYLWESLSAATVSENSRKRPTIAKGRQLAPHAISGALWCQKIPGKWSPCSPRVARGSKVGMGEEREDWVVSVFPFFF
jgi:hypothetical protein